MKLSKEKRDKISEQILFYLYGSSPVAQFTSTIAREIARDEEFVKFLMFELHNKNLVMPVRKNHKGQAYSRRIRWRLSNNALDAYKKISN